MRIISNFDRDWPGRQGRQVGVAVSPALSSQKINLKTYKPNKRGDSTSNRGHINPTKLGQNLQQRTNTPPTNVGIKNLLLH
jgi:hypothetical protein